MTFQLTLRGSTVCLRARCEALPRCVLLELDSKHFKQYRKLFRNIIQVKFRKEKLQLNILLSRFRSIVFEGGVAKC